MTANRGLRAAWGRFLALETRADRRILGALVVSLAYVVFWAAVWR